MKPEPGRTLSPAQKVLILCCLCAGSLGLHALLIARTGHSMVALCVLPMVAAGLLYGLGVGLAIAGLVGCGFLFLSYLGSHPHALHIIDVAGVVLVTVSGGVVGRLRDLRKRLGDALGKTSAVESVLWHINSEITAINEQLEQDRRAARRIQQSLIPRAKTGIPGVSVDWFFEPSEEVGGDLFNIFRIDEHHAAVYILDVSGHGVPAAFYTIGLSRALSPDMGGGSLLKKVGSGGKGYSLSAPAEVARCLNEQFQQSQEQEQFFTLVYGLLDLRTWVLEYVVAGHPGPAWFSPDQGARVLAEPSYPVGVDPESSYEQRRMELRPGDRVFLYTDGLTEMPGAAGGYFGDQGLMEAVTEAGGLELPEAVERIRRRLDEFRGDAAVQDDVALLALEVGCEEVTRPPA